VEELTALPLALGAFGFALVVDGSISIGGKVLWTLALIVLPPIAIPALLISRRPAPA
jgi:hypothetical protein